MKKLTHPNFILGLFSMLLIFIGVGLQANHYASGDAVLIGALGLGGIHWIWSIIDVLRDYRTANRTEDRNILWVIIAVIPVGGLFYYGMGRKVTV
jgi:hypothetical protein